MEKDRRPPAGRPINEQDKIPLYRTWGTAALHRCLRVKLNHWRQELWIYTFSFTVCGVSRKHHDIFSHFFLTFRSLAVVQNLGISTRGWLVFNCVFRFGEHKCTQFLSGLKKVVFLYYIHTTYDTIVEWRTKCARANSHTPGVAHCLCKVCGWLWGVVKPTAVPQVRLLKSLRSSSFSSFLHGTCDMIEIHVQHKQTCFFRVQIKLYKKIAASILYWFQLQFLIWALRS